MTTDPEKAPQPDKVSLYDPMITATMYQCYWCQRWAAKDKWLPHCNCPWCDKRAPSGEEFQALKAASDLVWQEDLAGTL